MRPTDATENKSRGSRRAARRIEGRSRRAVFLINTFRERGRVRAL